LLAAFVFEPEARAQQAAGIVGHAPQPGFVGEPAFAFGGRFGALAGGLPRLRRLPATRRKTW